MCHTDKWANQPATLPTPPGPLACGPHCLLWWLIHPSSELYFHLASWHGKFCAPPTVAERPGFAHTVCHTAQCYSVLVASPTYFNMFRHAAEPRSSERERLNSMFVGRGAHQLARLRPRVFRLTTISSNMDKRTHCNNKLLRLPKKSKLSCSKQQKCPPPSAGRNTPMNCSFHTFVLTLYSNGTYSTPLQFSLNPTVALLRLLSQEMLTQDSPKEDSATFGKSVKASLKLWARLPSTLRQVPPVIFFDHAREKYVLVDRLWHLLLCPYIATIIYFHFLASRFHLAFETKLNKQIVSIAVFLLINQCGKTCESQWTLWNFTLPNCMDNPIPTLITDTSISIYSGHLLTFA